MHRALRRVLPAILVSAALCAPALAGGGDALARFRAAYPRAEVRSFVPSPVPGLYEVTAGENVFYYSPAGDHLLFGEIVDRNGRNLTAERRAALADAAAAEIPLEGAVRVGSGPVRVVLFTDPDCPYCKRVKEFLASPEVAPRVTQHVFFRSLRSGDPGDDGRVTAILSAPDPAAAYAAYPAGKTGEITEKGRGLAAAHAALARRFQVNAVPVVFVEGTRVTGADLARIGKLLEEKSKKER